MGLCIGSYVIVTLADGEVLEGSIVKIGNGHIVIDEVRTFGDWVFIEDYNILSICSVC